jgi:hypothetical protein
MLRRHSWQRRDCCGGLDFALYRHYEEHDLSMYWYYDATGRCRVPPLPAAVYLSVANAYGPYTSDIPLGCVARRIRHASTS